MNPAVSSGKAVARGHDVIARVWLSLVGRLCGGSRPWFTLEAAVFMGGCHILAGLRGRGRVHGRGSTPPVHHLGVHLLGAPAQPILLVLVSPSRPARRVGPTARGAHLAETVSGRRDVGPSRALIVEPWKSPCLHPRNDQPNRTYRSKHGFYQLPEGHLSNIQVKAGKSGTRKDLYVRLNRV